MNPETTPAADASTPECAPDCTPKTECDRPATGFPGEDLIRRLLPAEVEPLFKLIDDIEDGGSFDQENIWASLEATAALGRKFSTFLGGQPKVAAVPQAAAEAGSVPSGTLVERCKAALASAEPCGPPLATADGSGKPVQAVALNPALAALLMQLAQQAIQSLLAKLLTK